MEKHELVKMAVTAAVAVQVFLMALFMVMFLFVAAASDKIDVPGLRWNPTTQTGD